MNAPRPLLALCLVLSACGGTVVFEEDGGEGGGGGGTTSGGGITSGSVAVGTTGPSSSTASGNGGGTSVASAVSASAVSVGTGGGGACASHTIYTDCLGDGACVPLFDDACCSSCFPGKCADCVSYEFVGCADRLPPRPEGACVDAPCGFAPDWACAGTDPVCETCFAEPGCVEKLRCQGNACKVSCEGVRPDACGPVDCDAPPPSCFDGEVPEAGGGCWTGACLPAWVCSLTPPL